MIKITFEVSEDLIKERTTPEYAAAEMTKVDDKAMKVLFDMVGFNQIKRQIEEGKTEFVVTPDKLDEKSMQLYNNELGVICIMAAFSETDKKE